MTLRKRRREPGEKKLALASLLLLLLGAGCSSEPGTVPENTALTPEEPALPLGEDQPTADVLPDAFRDASTNGAPEAGVSPATASLTLEEAIRAALEHNPSLRVIRQGERVSQAALEVAQTYPFNPKLGLDVRPWARESNGNNADVLVAASLLQEIELAGQGSYRERAGAADLDRARHEILQAEILTISEAARRFFTALYRRERRDLEERFAGLKEERLGSVERRFDAGMANAGDVSLAKIEARLAREQAMAALASEDAALKDLAKYVGSPPGTSLSLVGRLESREWKELAPPERSGPSQADALLAGRPDVLAAEASLKAASARSDLAAASRVPNVSLGPVYERDEAGTQFLGVEAQIPLPVFNGGGPLLRQRQAEVEERQEALKQAQLKAKLEADAAASRYERARALVAQFREDLSGGLENELERVKNLYEAGQADILQVYGARASVLQARKSFLDAVYEVALSAADWTAATAQSPEVLLSSPARKERPR